jgi:hypothetical protein
MYGGLGQSVGAIIGGNMSKKMGIVKTFFYTGAADFIAINLFIFYQIHKRFHLNRQNDLNKSVVAKTMIENVKS